jgi:hypothetical protein
MEKPQMRNRILITLAAIAATLGIAAPSATAAVEVANDGEVTLEGYMAIETTRDTQSNTWRCAVEIDADIGSDGDIEVNNVEPTWDYNVAEWYCDPPAGSEVWFNDCDDNGWEGQIIGPGDSWERGDEQFDYAATGDFEALIETCTRWHDYYTDGVPPPVIRLAIDEHVNGNEYWALPAQPLYSWVSTDPVTITTYGSNEYLPPTDLDITSVE